MKRLLCSLLLSIVAYTSCYADASSVIPQVVNVPVVGSLNLTNFLANAGIIDTYDNHGVNRAGAAVRGLWYPTDPTAVNPADMSLIALEGLVTWDTANGAPAGLGLWLGLRLDTIGAKLLKPGIGHLTIPNVEFGPMAMYLPNNHDKQHWVYGGALAKHFN